MNSSLCLIKGLMLLVLFAGCTPKAPIPASIPVPPATITVPPAPKPVPPAPLPAPPAPKAKAADPASMTYRSIWRESGQVTLVKGVFRTPVAPGSDAELIVRLTDRQVFGKIDGKEMGVVVLVTQAGGSGSFFDLALLTRKGDDWVNSDVAPLGDRVDVQGLALRDNQVVVTMTSHSPNDLMCCPTQRTERRFTVQGGKLVAVDDPAVTPAPATLVGPVWQWVQTLYNNDTKARPPRPGNYTVQFDADGTVNARADCNHKGGTFQSKDQSLAIEFTRSTRAMCPEDSLEDRFVRDLTSASHWFIKAGELFLDLKYDTGTMRFQPPR